MPIDSTGIESQIDSNLPDNNSRQNGAAVVRAILKTVVRWVRDAVNNNLSTWLRISDKQPGGANGDAVYRTGKSVFGRDYSNGTAAAFEATTGWIDNLNGNKVSPWFTISQPGDGLGSTQYYGICELAAPTGGTYDYAQVEFVGKPWSVDNSTGSALELSMLFTNRGGFKYQYTSRGDAVGGFGIVCQQMPDGRVVVYMYMDNAFKAISARVTSSIQTTIYDGPSYRSSLAGMGTEVFNSTKPSQYRPLWAVRSRFTALNMTNSDGSWPAAPISEAGSAQLTFGANSVPGSSEVSQINSNLVGGGFSWWQQTGATAKRMLAYLNGTGDLLLNGRLALPSFVGNRKITLYDTTGNDHQFYGFGIDPGGLRCQIDSTDSKVTWYAGVNPLSSNELMRLLGNGKLLIGLTSANDRDMLQVGGPISARYNEQGYNPTSGEVPAKSWRIVKNTANGEVRLWINDNNTMKSVLLS